MAERDNVNSLLPFSLEQADEKLIAPDGGATSAIKGMCTNQLSPCTLPLDLWIPVGDTAKRENLSGR
jgi:hypothetical protein